MSIEALNLLELKRSCAQCSLAELCLPAPVPVADRAQLDSLVRTRKELSRGEGLFAAGSALRAIYVVRTGAVKSFIEDPDGHSQILGFHLAGEVVGFDGLSEDRHRVHTSALERTSLCEVPIERLFELTARIPSIQRQLMRIASREIRRDHDHMMIVGRQRAPARMALFLLDLAQRELGCGGEGNEVRLQMSRYDIANYLGLVVETVSRVLTRFSEAGLIEVERRVIRILDRAGLLALARDAEDA